jgi:cytidylate kinase
VSDAAVPKRGTVVAIDGPAGAGKSTLAAALSRALDLPYVNTGLMYRALTRVALERGIDVDDAGALGSLALEIAGRFRIGGGAHPELVADGIVPRSLTSPDVESEVSRVARHPPVRSVMRELQRRLGAAGTVMEGRDIGTVVFPDADVKIFLLAAPGVRVTRRQSERPDGRSAEQVARAVARRDALDSKTNPLEAAPDAHVLDTTGLTREQVVAESLRLVHSTLRATVHHGGSES